MTKKKKIIVVALSVVGSIILLFVLIFVRSFYGGYIKVGFQTMVNAPSAKAAAKEYIKEKYGEKPKRVSGTEPIYSIVGFFLNETMYFEGVTVKFDDYEVRVLFDEDTGKLLKDRITDNRQYDEICYAVEKRYFDDKNLGTSYTGRAFVNFSNIYYENMFTSAYFDGDIDKFIKETRFSIDAEITYEGCSEKKNKYKEIVNNKLNEIKENTDIHWLGVSIFVRDPEFELPEEEKKYKNYEHIWIDRQEVVKFENYPELMAYGVTYSNEKDENIVYAR